MSDMLVRLYDLPDSSELVQKLRAEGVTLRLAMAYEKHRVLEFVRSTFGAGWADECDVCFARVPISCLLATREGVIVGFACYDGVCRDFFGPMGVEKSFRGRSIGKALLLEGLRAMAHQGYAYAIIGYAGPGDFYARAAGAIEIPNSAPGIYRDMLKK